MKKETNKKVSKSNKKVEKVEKKEKVNIKETKGKTKVTKKREKADKKKTNIFRSIANWFKNLFVELKKVSWPSRRDIWKNFFATISCVIFLGILFYLIDIIMVWLKTVVM